MRRFLSTLAIVIILVNFLPDSSVLAQQPTPSDDEVNELAKEIYCPVCENTPLDVCPTKACAQWRELIREKMQQGWTEDEIKQFFASQYGERVLAEPSLSSPFGIIHLFPPLVVGLLIVVVFRVIRTGRRKVAEKMVPEPMEDSIQEDLLAKVEDELSQYNKR